MYYPFLRWKAGEMRALENAPFDWADMICPIWFSDSYDGYQDLVLGVQSVWSDHQIIDLTRIDIEEAPTELLENLVESSLRFAIKFEDFELLPSELLENFYSAPVFRVSVDETCSALLISRHVDVEAIIQSMPTPPVVVIDVGYIDSTRETDPSAMARVIDDLYELGVDEVVLSGGSFPISLDGYIGYQKFPRRELEFYSNTDSETGASISYSDYCTLHPDWEDSGILRSNHSAIKYTIDGEWLVIRQHGKDTKALLGLAKLLCMHEEFRMRTAQFSWADGIWSKRAATPPEAGPGNSTFHVSEFIHHHIAQVLKRE